MLKQKNKNMVESIEIVADTHNLNINSSIDGILSIADLLIYSNFEDIDCKTIKGVGCALAVLCNSLKTSKKELELINQ